MVFKKWLLAVTACLSHHYMYLQVAFKTGEYKQQVIFIGGLTDGLLATEYVASSLSPFLYIFFGMDCVKCLVTLITI